MTCTSDPIVNISRRLDIIVPDLLADVVEVAVDAPEDVQLDHHGGLLVPGDLSLVALHEQGGGHVLLGDVNLHGVLVEGPGNIGVILLTWLPDVIETDHTKNQFIE